MPTAYTQSDFSGGMNLFDEGPNIGSNQYGLAYSIRNRNGSPVPINLPIEDDTLIVGKKQGIYAFEDYLLVFVNGLGYYKHIVNDTVWTQIENLTLSPEADYIYAQAVPASRLNYDRKLKENSQIAGTSAESALDLSQDLTIQGSPYGLVVQDGINQGYLILPDGSARLLQTYEQWTRDNREYVPVMKQMAYVDGILFGIAADGKTILRSVSGRPIDFVVNVDTAGNKGGDAFTTAHAVGFDTITCLQAFGKGQLIAASINALKPIQLDYENTIFGEPKFKNAEVIPGGVVNQFSFINYLHPDGVSDSYFIDFDGLRSINAAATQGNEGRNSAFTSGIKLSLTSKQNVTAAIVFDDYSMFSVRTIHDTENNLVAVYDNIRRQWVCFDRHNIGSIKQFAIAKQGSSPILYVITETAIYKLFSSLTSAQATMRFKAITTGDAAIEMKLSNIRAVFINSNSTGTVSAYAIVDGVNAGVNHQKLRGLPRTENIRFPFIDKFPSGYTISPEISWQNNCNLYLIQLDATGNTQETNKKQQANKFATS